MMRMIINEDRKISIYKSIDALKVIVYDDNSWDNIFYDTIAVMIPLKGLK